MGWHVILQLLLALLIFCVTGGCTEEEPRTHDMSPGPQPMNDIFPGLQPINVQMHIHGFSNHNGSPMPGSMQWHTAWAAQTGTNVIWWSDHAESFEYNLGPSVQTLLSVGTLDPQTLAVTNLGTGAHRCTTLRPTVTGGEATASLDTNGLQIHMHANDTATHMQWLSYEAQGEKGTIQGTRWARPVNSGAQFQVELAIPPLNANQRFEIRVALAWHKYAEEVQQTIIFRFVTGITRVHTVLINPDTVLVRVPTRPGMILYTLDMLTPARLLRDGIDNTINRISFHLGAKHGATATAVLKSFRQNSTAPHASGQLATSTSLAQSYAATYGVPGHIGVETGRKLPSILHTNAFLPYPLNDVQLLTNYRTDEQLKAWIAQIHTRGGLVSINHPYGTLAAFHPLLPPAERRAATLRLLDTFLGVQGYGADLLEVGYLARGGADLLDHLRLWDKLTANNLFLGGTGVTDAHGGRWQTCLENNRLNNCFTTWVLSPGAEASELLEGLRQKRVFFGNHFLWQGIFAFQVGQAVMGERVSIPEDTAQFVLQFAPWPADTRVYLVQGVVKAGSDVEYLHHRTLVHPGEQPVLNTSRSSFVRLEAWRTATGPSYFPRGEPLVFTNPIVLLRQ